MYTLLCNVYSLFHHFSDQSLDISNKDFNRPAAALGVSSPDGRIDVPIPDDGPVTYEIVEGGSQKGGNRLVSSDGYTYTVRVSILTNIHVFIYLPVCIYDETGVTWAPHNRFKPKWHSRLTVPRLYIF